MVCAFVFLFLFVQNRHNSSYSIFNLYLFVCVEYRRNEKPLEKTKQLTNSLRIHIDMKKTTSTSAQPKKYTFQIESISID